MGFYLHVPFFFLLQTCSFYILILMSAVAKIRRMQMQNINIIIRINKQNMGGYIYSFKVRHLEYVINYSFLRISRNLCNLHKKPPVTRNFATLTQTQTCLYYRGFNGPNDGKRIQQSIQSTTSIIGSGHS